MDLFGKIAVYLANHSGQFLLFTLILSVLALVLAIGLFLRIRPFLRPFAKIRESSERPEDVLAATVRQLEANEKTLTELSSSLESLIGESRRFFAHAGLVRYDAFEDIGGQQSFSLCLLNSDRDGFIITNLTSRNSVRSYAVSISSGEPARKLSDEENGALSEALSHRTTMLSN